MYCSNFNEVNARFISSKTVSLIVAQAGSYTMCGIVLKPFTGIQPRRSFDNIPKA